MRRSIRPIRRSTLGVVGAIVLGGLLAGGVVALALPAGHGIGGRAAPPSEGTAANPASCTIATDASCVVALVGSGWTADPVSTWCRVNSTFVPGVGPNASSNSTSTLSFCAPSVGYAGFNMSGNGTLAGAFSSPGPFSVWIVPVQAVCATLYYSIANVPVSCPLGVDPYPAFSWERSISGPGSIDLAGPTGAVGVLPGASWEILLVDTASTPESITVTASITLAPA